MIEYFLLGLKMENLDSKSFDELRDIAGTIGLTFSRMGKEELKLTIKTYYLTHERIKGINTWVKKYR